MSKKWRIFLFYAKHWFCQMAQIYYCITAIHLKPRLQDKLRIRNTDGKWILHLRRNNRSLLPRVIGRGNYITRLPPSRMAANYRRRTPRLIKPEIAIFSRRGRARFDFVPVGGMNKAGRAKFDAGRVIYGALFFQDYAHKDALKSNQFLRTRRNMRLHESQNFHFHNVHNNAHRLMRGELTRIHESFRRRSLALYAHQL